MIDHKEARELYEYAVERDEVNRDEAVQDLRFRAGEQWDEQERQRREMQQRPCLVLNMTGQYVRHITGAARMSPPSITVIPADDVSDPGRQQQAAELAQIKEGMIREIEHRSRGRWQYISALENAVTAGMGSIRVLTEYDERDPFKQVIRFTSVSDALAVVYDPDAKRLTKEDGTFAFVTGVMSPRAFKAKFPKAKRSGRDWERRDDVGDARWWEKGDTIRVVEMFRRVPVPKKAVLLSSGAQVDVTGLKRAEMEAFAQGVALRGLEIVDERSHEDHRVMRAVLDGEEYLEDDVEFPSRHIPLVPFLGEEIAIGEHRVRHGVVRFLRDPQRLYNYYRTAGAEAVALAPKAPFLATERQIGPYKALWEQSNKLPLPYLLYHPDPDAATALPSRAVTPDPPNAIWQEGRNAVDDMKGVTGIYDASLGAQGNETSGRAIMARQREGQVGTFLYMDNMRHAVERLGVILLDMLPRVYDTERGVRIMEENGEGKPARINVAMPDGSVMNDLSSGVHEVKVSTGPTWQSRREETAQAVIELMNAAPEVRMAGLDILVESLDFPRADELAERIKAMMQGPQEQQPDPMQEMQAQALQARAAKDAASAGKTQAEAEGVALENLARMAGPVSPWPGA